MNFGPLEQARRRTTIERGRYPSREKVVLITSIKASDIDKDTQALEYKHCEPTLTMPSMDLKPNLTNPKKAHLTQHR